jgi:hypothetical protein
MAEGMRIAVLVALNMVFFQGAWWCLISPPITLLAATLNLTLYRFFVCRRRLGRRFTWSAIAGLLSALAIAMYLVHSQLVMSDVLFAILPDPVLRAIPTTLLGMPRRYTVEFALMDLFGVFAMILAARVVPERSVGPTERAANGACS